MALLKLNIQRFAPQLGNLRINFDSHIKKVVATSSDWTTSYTWTTSGEVIFLGASYLQIVTFDVTLDDGYVIDNVTLDTSYETTLETKNDKQFTIKCGSDILGSPITITSKQQTSSTTHKLTFDSNITITVNGSSVTTSPYNLNNGDVITATTDGYEIIINGTLYSKESTIAINNQDINIVRSKDIVLDLFSVTINYTETSTPTYTFKHWKKSNVVVNRTLVGQKYYYFKPYTILGLYIITTTLTNCKGASANATKIQENGGLTLTFTANSGYELPTGISVTNVTSYNWNKSTGVLAISKPTGDVAIEIVAVSALPQLATPTNVAVTDTTLTFDEVTNATSYEVFVDNVSIGTHKNVVEYQVTVTNSNPNNIYNVENISIYESDTNSLSVFDGMTKLGEISSNQTMVFNITKKYVLISNTYGSVYNYSGGLTLVNSDTNGNTLFEVSNNGTVTAMGYFCLTGDTLITLADGTQKRIDELTLKDKVLSYNPTTQELETDEITYVDSMENKTYTEYDIWTFSNGTIIKTVHRHRFYNVERQEMTYMERWNIGEHAINQNGELITLVSHENVKEKVKHYTIFTKNQNYYANGLLSGNRYTKSLHLVGNSNPIERDNKGGQ